MSRYRGKVNPPDGERRVGNVGLLIFEAARQGSLENLRFALNLPGAKNHVNYSDRFGQTPLIVAAMNGHMQCVKLLLCYSADIHSTMTRRGQEITAADAAARHGWMKIACYLRGCIDDLIKFQTTRAHMETDVLELASKPSCTLAELEEFTVLLQRLIQHCGFTIDGDEDESPLLLSAVKAANVSVAEKLIEEFNATLFANDNATGENALHFACENKSKLRFYITLRCQDLLKNPDINGCVPLHVACSNDDIEFVSWLLKSITDEIDKESVEQKTSSMPRTSSLPDLPSAKRFAEPSVNVCTSIQRAITFPKLRRQDSIEEVDGLEPLEEENEGENEFPKLEDLTDGEFFLSHSNSLESSSHSTFHNSMEASNESKPDVDDVQLQEPTPPCPLTLIDIIELKLFRVTMKGESIVHILAREGFADLLSLVLRVARFLQHNVDLEILTCRDGFMRHTPLEQAIIAQKDECVRLLIQFAGNVGMLNANIDDDRLLKAATFTNNIEIVKILIENGFHEGLKQAITQAYVNENDAILRLLMYYHTQVENSLEFTRVRRNRVVTLDSGGINWNSLHTEHIQAAWLYDSYNAVDSVSRTLSKSVILDSPLKDRKFFCQLGVDCLRYFETLNSPSVSPVSLAFSLVPIREVNLSENQLSSVPPDLFQMPNLHVLKLSNNNLTALPSSKFPGESIYTAMQLKKLVLDWNQLKTLPEDLFRGLGHTLESLSVQHNQLEELPPGMWIAPKLKNLRLSWNRLTHLHCLSNPRYFNDTEFTRRIVSSFTVEGGSLRKKDTSEDNSYGTKEYFQKLEAFCHTVHAIKGDAKDSYETVLQGIVDVHWARYHHANQSLQTTYEASVTIYEEASQEGEEEQEPDYSNLTHLDLSHNKFTEVPWDLPCVAPKLQRLDLQDNLITDLDIARSMPATLSTLILDNNQIFSTTKSRPVSRPCGNPMRLFSLPAEHTSLYCSHCCHQCLEHLTNLTLDMNQLEQFDVADIIQTCICEDPDIPGASFDNINYLPYFPNLSILSLANNKLSSVPLHLHYLTHISSITLSHNLIHEFPLEMGLINQQSLLILKLEGLYIRNVPQNVLNKPVKYLLSYLKSLLQKSRPYRRIKLMVVGGANQGKTSLLLNLTKKGKMSRFKEVTMDHNYRPLATVGVDLGDWEYAPAKRPKVTFMTWDFGGQEEYYATHQCFLTNRSLYLLVWKVTEGEAGLLRLKPWLENIEGRAPGSPVIIIGTHVDELPSSSRSDTFARLRTRFKEFYVDYDHNVHMLPKIEPRCLFVNCFDHKHMDGLRDYIYDFVMRYKPPAPRRVLSEILPLLEQPIPTSYIKLQDIVRCLAQRCADEDRIPIYTKKEYILAVHNGGFLGKLDELEQATSFLHDNGILLHYEDALLSDLYFVNPQWLCSMLANVVTVQERNPFQKNGFMPMDALSRIFHDISSDFSLVKEFITLMQKFGVVLMLDEHRLLIPSLLPSDKKDLCLVFPRSVSLEKSQTVFLEELKNLPHASISHTPHPIFARYYLLPFIPNGLFSRLTARLASSDIIELLRKSLCVGPMEEHHVINILHWGCWRNGIVLIWNQMEIFRIAPISHPLPGDYAVNVISNTRIQKVETLKGVEIKVAILPEECITSCTMANPGDKNEPSFLKGKCLATWLLHQATDFVDSVFEDWYEAFARRKGLELSVVKTVNPCQQCFNKVREAETQGRRLTFSLSFSSSFGLISRRAVEPKEVYTFTNGYCALMLDKGETLECPVHGSLTVEYVAPDLVFNDFPPSMLFMDPKAVVLKKVLGDGGYGSVYSGTVNRRGETLQVAVKQFHSMGLGQVDPDPEGGIAESIAESDVLEVYQNASVEARMMLQLNHPHVLGLIGLTFQPTRLLLELAPLGDLKNCVKKFQRQRVRLSRRTLKATMIQVAEALDYLHSQSIVYRDLKPGNVLVWKFPLPENQWNPESNVYIKLADYGVCKYVSPQGIRGLQGTGPYLPPEVILHGGREAYTTKIDVYSYAMFLYYLFTFMNPFESDPRPGPITALLEEGRRPELMPKFRPASLQMFELMCWCWSDKPQHRPDFQEILRTLRTDTFTHLLAATPVTRDKVDVTAACLYTTKAPIRRHSTYTPTSSLPELSFPCSGVMSLLHSTVSGYETSVQIWYGTENGTIGMVQYQPSGIVLEQVDQPAMKFISCMRVVGDNIWVSTVGRGLWVYNTASKQQVAMWGATERHQIYLLLHVKETSSILALTHKGMFVFLSDIPSKEVGPASCDILTPSYSYPRSGNDINQGVVIPEAGNLESSEVWVCTQRGLGFQVLHPRKFHVMEEILIPEESSDHHGRKIRHLEPMVVDGRSTLMVADRRFVQKWDVQSREMQANFDCYEACKHVYENHIKNSRVTSLLDGKEVFYVGTGGGVILSVNAEHMEVCCLLHAYNEPVRCLLMVTPGRQVKPFLRMFSRKDSGSLHNKSPRTSLSSATSLGSVDEPVPEERTVLLSFGLGYRGVVGDSPNHPSVFILPSDSSVLCTGTRVSNLPRLVRSPPTIGHLLLWSAETDSQKAIPSFEELEENQF